MCGSVGGNRVGERNHLPDGELLGAMFRADFGGPGDIPPEDRAELLAALREDALREGGEACGLSRERMFQAGDGDHRTRDVGPRPEALSRKGRDVADLAKGLGDDADLAVVPGAGRGRETFGDLALDGDEEASAARVIEEEREHQGRGGAVGQVGDEREGPIAERGEGGGGERALVLEAVAFDQRETGSEFGMSPEAFAIERGEAGVELAGDDVAATREEFFRERSGAGADLKNEVSGADAAGIHELADEVVVDEEVLTERLLGREAPGIEELADLGQGLHVDAEASVRPLRRDGKLCRARAAGGGRETRSLTLVIMSFNDRLAERFERIAKILELLGEDKFRVNAHSRAARTVEGQAVDLSTLSGDKKALTAIEGIGPKIADKIVEFATSGRIAELEELEARVPPGLLLIMEIPGLGPKTVAMLWQQAKVETLEDLKRIIDDGSILTLPRMGEKSVEKIKKSMAFVAEGNKRLELGIAMPLAELIVGEVEKWPGVERAAFAGSLRRGKDTIGDIDILVATSDMAGASDRFAKLPGVVQVLSSGEGKSSVRMRASADLGRWGADATGPTVQVDLRVIPLDRWGAAMMYFTGSKEHNIRMRERALKRGMTLTEWGLFPNDEDETPPHKRGIKPIAAWTEKEVFAALELAEVPPEIREDRGEIALAEAEFGAGKGKKREEGLPRLIEVSDIKAELHAHTTASDGKLSIVELAGEAKRRGFHTITVTDHSKSSAVAGGLSPERLLEHIEAIHAARKEVKGIAILAGSEVDILADGSLDYEDALLAKLDVVVASPHASLSQEPAVATKRLVRAIEHPMVHILGHPTGRLLNRRPGLEPDMRAIYEAAKGHGVALEINAHWMRLDLRDTHVKGAMEAGCLVSIDCDVHDPADFDNLRYGVVTARRGWVTPDRCVNTWEAARLQAWLKQKR